MEQTREPERDEKQRDRNAKTNENLREPTTITFNIDDFSPKPASPIESYFTLPPISESDIEEDHAVALVHCKQHNLAVIHEHFRHLSFSILKLMA